MAATDELLAEQIRYYRERAPEYDATAPYESGPFAELTTQVVEALQALGPAGRAIELGAGTGQFTRVLAAIADHVTAVDASPEVLELNRSKLDAAGVDVDFVVADVFDYVPDTPADLVVSAALLSHIPSARFDAFWSAVDRMLAPGGRVFVVDEARHALWSEEPTGTDEVVVRTLQDGRRFRIVKVLWDPDQLTGRLAAIGWRGAFVRRDPFYWGTVERSAD
jgi:demethylmenaquinone methyltransferase/2-methoxy-6-polyprenyl-1,4-benzoquinol methylase